MVIQIFTNNSEHNKVDKDISELGSFEFARLKEETDIINPTILLSGVSADVIGAVNYIYIPEFNRYYFVDTITYVRNNLYSFDCRVDVLMSFRDYIRTNKAIINKQSESRHYNLYVNDGSLKSYQNPIIHNYPFPNGFTSDSFVLLVAGA